MQVLTITSRSLSSAAVILIRNSNIFFLYSESTTSLSFTFFFNDTATTEIYTLSLHDALPIFGHEAEAVVRRVWGSVDTVMLIFAGSAAEFAVNKAVDWLFWTNALPSAPIKRFFETVSYAQAVLLGDAATVVKQIAAINGAHRGVERSRGYAIPAWAYRDVLFMLIDYGERAHRVVYGPMSARDRVGHWTLMRELGEELHVEDLPADYPAYLAARRRHLLENTAHTPWTDQLYAAYRKDLGPLRMPLL